MKFIYPHFMLKQPVLQLRILYTIIKHGHVNHVVGDKPEANNRRLHFEDIGCTFCIMTDIYVVVADV